MKPKYFVTAVENHYTGRKLTKSEIVMILSRSQNNLYGIFYSSDTKKFYIDKVNFLVHIDFNDFKNEESFYFADYLSLTPLKNINQIDINGQTILKKNGRLFIVNLNGTIVNNPVYNK